MVFIKEMLTNQGFIFTFWLRICKFYEHKPLMLLLPKVIYRHYKKVFVSDIDYHTHFGSGICIYHLFGTAIDPRVSFGDNIVLSHNVTLGGTFRGEREGAPKIGNNVYIGPGALVIGNITVGNNVAIGGNAVVTKDVPDNSVVVGIPGKVISDQGAKEYVRNTDYKI